jgi:Zn finger protein HypA/HybF involved in hydrogenase expression
MRKIIDVRCGSCGHVQEEFGHLTDAFRCGECGGESERIISPVRCALEGVSGDFPGAAIKWAKDRTKRGGNS